MPIEIRELVIRVAIEQPQKQHTINQRDIDELKNKLIKECTEKILLKLDNVYER
ncbi:DUF5908 family protein [Mucilaginibacter polytrichastri]|uniref:Uncharacterized protein n=1 Tax=Mucilaginibacter polytrichastri TaxID=1302689 RepID=A0A1Q5ZXQ2_9SPHI|nr:DUF5908 family protein [Mucilaginibacter polytrichastri]OKS86518.1 hypothetical protein RG47T_1974 [Mucilaginibacter polytrichastri]SFS79397.1 hypothetical protein SAMN04487890_10492 [Mucilaginibacter polytrichastri]